MFAMKVEISRYHLRTHMTVFDIEVWSIDFDGCAKAGVESESIKRILSFLFWKFCF